MATLSNETYKGTSDWLPEEFSIRKLIFDTWRRVCVSYGYQEYLTPLVEPTQLYKAKSGEDLGGKELMTLVDKGGRELAIRPEMTPSVTRMVTKIYSSSPKPLRLFSIANFMRAEKPQRGRNREFWQLNYDIFGSKELDADLEILLISDDIMMSFSPPNGSYKIRINNRKLLNDFAVKVLAIEESEKYSEILHVMDKWGKLPEVVNIERLEKLGLDSTNVEKIKLFLTLKTEADMLKAFPELSESEGLKDLQEITNRFSSLGKGERIEFSPSLIRGFDYYDGLIFEVFDEHPDNKRALFGGGRYNGLSSLFGMDDIPAVGCAPGDETLKLFLESWGLIERLTKERVTESYYIPLIDPECKEQMYDLADSMRSKGEVVELGVEVQKIGKALAYADKKGTRYVVLLGKDELSGGYATIKDLEQGSQNRIPLSK